MLPDRTKTSWFRRETSQRGSSMIQFAIAFPIFMMFLVVIIDLGRSSALGNVIREGLALGMQQAASVPNLDIDPKDLPQSDYWYQRSKIARQLVETAALRMIHGSHRIHTEADTELEQSHVTKLYDIVFTESRIADGPDQQTYKVAVLLPGECVEVPALGIIDCNRETLGTTPNDLPPLQPARFLINNHPVKLVAYAQFDSFSPWLFKRWQKFEQYGFRQPIPKTPFPTDIDPQPLEEMVAELNRRPGTDPLPKARTPKPSQSQTCEMSFSACLAPAAPAESGGCPCPNSPGPVPPFCQCRTDCCGPDPIFN